MIKSRMKKWTQAAVCAAVAGGTLVASERPAHALMDPWTMQAYVDVAYSVVRLGKEILGSSDAPQIIQKLTEIEAAIISEMRTIRNQALQSNTRAVFQLFRMLADNAPGDPTNASSWSNIVTLQQQTATQMFDIIQSANDAQSSYELTPAYNALLATGANVLRIKKDIWPAFPSSWNDYYIWLQPGMQANYKMIGSRRHECWDGQNPGYRPPPTDSAIALAVWKVTTQDGKYKQSQLWTKKINNRNIHVETYRLECPGVGRTPVVSTLKRYCNPATRSCPLLYPIDCTSTRTWRACESGVEPLVCADRFATATFDADPAVQITRSGMRALQTLSGGNDFDAPNNNGYLTFGMYVDPWVNEPACGTNPWGYAQQP